MDTNFASPASCYLIITQSNNFRRYITLEYDDALEAPVAA
jgi:hypothetical protein